MPQVRTFLLERSRVTSTSKAKERSYHILYELVAGGTPHTQGKAPEAFHFLSLSGTTTVDGHDDKEEFEGVGTALLAVGFSEAELDNIWAFLASMLWLGNVKFGAGDTAAIADAAPLKTAEGQLGVGDMANLLVTKMLTVNGESTTMQYSPMQARRCRAAPSASLAAACLARPHASRRVGASHDALGRTLCVACRRTRRATPSSRLCSTASSRTS
jgi:myosin heavy subunit